MLLYLLVWQKLGKRISPHLPKMLFYTDALNFVKASGFAPTITKAEDDKLALAWLWVSKSYTTAHQ